MTKLVLLALGLVLAAATTASAQPNVTLDTPFQLRAVPKLKKSDVIAITNDGATNNNLCAHVYAFEPGGQLLACCSCLVAPNTLAALAIGPDILENRKPFPKAAIFKVLASVPVSGTCSATAVGALSSGLVVAKGEAPFTTATLSAGELSGLMTRCSFLQATPTTCVACRATP